MPNPSDREARRAGVVRPTNCFRCRQRGRSEWSALKDLEGGGIERLNGARSEAAYLANQVIFRQGTPCRGIHCIESGVVAILTSAA
jgi:CRP-like cAMP-binding protein